MVTRLICAAIVFSLVFPASALAYTRGIPKSAPAASTPAPEAMPVPQHAPKTPLHEDPAQMEKGRQPVRVPHPMTEEEYNQKMKSAHSLMVAGMVMAIGGGVAAIAGSAYAIAKRDDRLVGGIIGASGLALGLAGGLLQIWGANKRQEAEQGWTYGLAPVVDPAHRSAGLAFNARF